MIICCKGSFFILKTIDDFDHSFYIERMNALISVLKPPATVMRSLVFVLKVLLFIGLTTVNFEYLVNRQSSTLLLIVAILVEIVIFYFLIYQPIKKHFL